MALAPPSVLRTHMLLFLVYAPVSDAPFPGAANVKNQTMLHGFCTVPYLATCARLYAGSMHHGEQAWRLEQTIACTRIFPLPRASPNR